MGERPLGHLLSPSDWTSWREESDLNLKLEIEVDGRSFAYSVTFCKSKNKVRFVKHEELTIDGTTTFRRNERYGLLLPGSDIRLPEIPIARTLSLLGIVGNDSVGKEPASFREILSTLVYAKPDPRNLTSTATSPVESPSTTLEDLSGWLLFLRDDQKFQDSLAELLKDVWPELTSFYHLEVARGFYRLTFLFGTSEGPVTLSLEELSDGERMLVALYSLAAYQKTRASMTLIIDEPDNYVSVREIQPWLLTMLNDRPDDGQLILVSHNPEIIQTMGRERVAYFSREDHLSPTKVSSLPPDAGGLSLPELLARGWVDV